MYKSSKLKLDDYYFFLLFESRTVYIKTGLQIWSDIGFRLFSASLDATAWESPVALSGFVK